MTYPDLQTNIINRIKQKHGDNWKRVAVDVFYKEIIMDELDGELLDLWAWIKWAVQFAPEENK